MNTAALATDLRTAVAILHKGLRKQMYSVGSYSMTETETIGHLYRQSLLTSELATLTRVKAQSMSQILKKMEEQGIIKRTPSKDDMRKVYISLTATGKKMVEQTRYDRDEWLRVSIEKSLTPKEMEVLAKAVPILNKLMEIK